MSNSSTRMAAAVVAAVSATSLGFSSLAPADARTSSHVSSAHSNSITLHSGEEMLRALIFGQGSLAVAIGDLAPQMEQTREVVQVTDAIVRHIKSTDEQFFDRFKSGVTSGTAARVDVALQEAGTQVASALRVLGYTDETGATGPSVTPRFAAVQVVLFAVAGVVVGVAAVLVTAAVATQTVMYPARSGSVASRGVSLSYDRWVAEIAVAFS